MEFRSYPNKDGHLKQRCVLKHGPIAPGTMLTYVPVVSNMDLRHGIIVAVHNDQVDVFWQSWQTRDGIEYGELRRKFGIPSAAEEKRRKWDEKKRRRALECKAGLDSGRLGP